MSYADKRAHAIALFREHMAEQFSRSVKKTVVFNELRAAMNALIQEFCTEHEILGVRYWEHPESHSFFATLPGESPPSGIDGEHCIELARHEFISRQRLHFGYEDRL